MDPVIKCQAVEKQYGNQPALQGIDLSISPGRIVGLLGKNGAGKSTLLKCILGLNNVTSGKLQVFGMNPWENRVAVVGRCSYVPDQIALEGWMRVKEYLQFLSRINLSWNQEKADAYLESFGLDRDRKIKTLSKGGKVKLAVLAALAVDTELLVLDEPLLGMDISVRNAFVDILLKEYISDERTIIISSHQLDELEDIFDEVVFIHEGKIICHENQVSLKERFPICSLSREAIGVLADESKYILNDLMGKQTVVCSHTAIIADSAVSEKDVAVPRLKDVFLAMVEGGLR